MGGRGGDHWCWGKDGYRIAVLSVAVGFQETPPPYAGARGLVACGVKCCTQRGGAAAAQYKVSAEAGAGVGGCLLARG